MLYFQADPRDVSGISGGACNTCCCQRLTLKPGETNKMTINYAPWSLPIGWVTPSMEYSIETNSDACATGDVGGFGPPSNDFLSASTASGAVSIDATATAQPAGNVFAYKVIALNGPYHGSVTNASGVFTYTPRAGYVGWDAFWYEMTDAQGRKVTRSVRVNVGATSAAIDPRWIAEQPFIDASKVMTDRDMQLVSFPIYMPLSAPDCATYRLTIKQPATNCDQTIFHHIACFDISTSDC